MEGSEAGVLGFGILVESGGGLVEKARKMAQNEREGGDGWVGASDSVGSIFLSVWHFPLVRRRSAVR